MIFRRAAGGGDAAVTHVDEYGETRSWDQVADTQIELLASGTGELVKLRQISRFAPLTQDSGTRQIHFLTTVDSMSAGEIIYLMAARWRQENYFRFAREYFALLAMTRTKTLMMIQCAWGLTRCEDAGRNGRMGR